MRQIIFLFAIVLSGSVLSGCNSNSKETHAENKQLIIFHAGSLSVPFKQMKGAFEKENTNVEILLEAEGSVKCARKITDLKRDCDIIVSADYTIIDEMLIPDYASWNIKFASNEMAIVYHKASAFSEEINAQNWYEILLRDDVLFGRSDPNSDPCGYRTVLTTQLAEDYYNQHGLTENVLKKNQEYIRPKEVDLLALLESNNVDYIFLYRSVAEQHKLNYVILPDSINLKDPGLSDFYSKAKTNITGKTPGSIITKTGQPMVYGITVLDNAPNKKLAQKFVDFALSQNGGIKIMEENGQPSTIPMYSETYSAIPEQLKQYAKHIP
ncbi:MAG: tungstate ABC transporter substrate-binding protein WtpA [Bacteroidetes bacterium]|nr:tungstate ABC transporter substrate-binding protein WtpA [Bacteroidota bacterium]MBL6943843.1 tungstate ABC transporter substrate-binding protein WtpA [Bacteroidales bacterium]